MSKSVSVIYSAVSDVVWTRSISELRAVAHRADVELDIARGMTRETLTELLTGSGIDVKFVPNTGEHVRVKAAVKAKATKAAKVHKVAVAREREAACGHRNCKADAACRWVGTRFERA
jgi:hypothetical protein